jgi:hypothetical protein
LKRSTVLTPISLAGLGLFCVMLMAPAFAAQAPDARRSPPAPANADSPSAARARLVPVKPEHAGDGMPPRSVAQPGEVSRATSSTTVLPRRRFGTPAQTLHPVNYGAANRGGALQSTQARGGPAGQPSLRMGSTGPASGVPGQQGPRGSSRNMMPVPKATAAMRNSPIGGPHAQNTGRLSGATLGRVDHSAAIDGTQRRPRF